MIENPTKIFPCDCMGEGLVVVKQDEDTNDCIGGPFIEMGFWNFGHVSEKRDWKWRLRTCWYILRKGTCWTDMVIMKARTAKNFAYHIIYLLNKDKERKQQWEPFVKDNNFGMKEPIVKDCYKIINDRPIKVLECEEEKKIANDIKEEERKIANDIKEELIEDLSTEIDKFDLDLIRDKKEGEPLVKEPISFMGTEIEGTMEEFPK